MLDRLEPEAPSYTRTNTRGDRYLVAPDKTTLVLDQTERTLEELHDLHEMILEEKEYDYGAVPEAKRKPFENYMPSEEDGTRSGMHAAHDSAHQATSASTSAPATPAPAHPKITARPNASSESELYDKENKLDSANVNETPNVKEREPRKLDQVEEDRLSALARENERLKKEIGSFDSEFFEELEDLKYRYSRLQEIVGEDPTNTSSGIAGRTSSSALPLDRLSWSVRNSMTAMDRAGLTSPLVSRPRYANAYTYAPGGGSSIGGSGGSGMRGNRDFAPSTSRGLGSTGGIATTGHVGGRLHATTGRMPTGHGGSTSALDKFADLGLSRPLYEPAIVDDRNPSPNGN